MEQALAERGRIVATIAHAGLNTYSCVRRRCPAQHLGRRPAAGEGIRCESGTAPQRWTGTNDVISTAPGRPGSDVQ